AILAAEELEKQGIGVTLVNSPAINFADLKTITAALQECDGKMITVEDHQALGGFGQLLCHALLQNSVTFKVKSLGVRGEFGRSAYSAAQLYEKFGIGHKAIIKTALEF